MKIKLSNRLRRSNGSICNLTADGTDFRIPEPTPFWSGWYSHKFNGLVQDCDMKLEFSFKLVGFAGSLGPLHAALFEDFQSWTEDNARTTGKSGS